MAGGPGMGMGGGMMFGPHLEALKPQLKLNAEQETRWAAATKQAEQMRQSGLANRDKMREEMRAELAKPAPDLGRIAALGDSVRSSQQALRQQTRDAWLQLYNSFTPEQKLVVRDAMLAATERGPHMRGRGAGPRA
jgi:Spy/CpxP family protein refolding chaperone